MAGGEPSMQIAGKPADVCPYCGAGMFATGTRQGESVTFRYVACRNPNCGKRFVSKQTQATLVREIRHIPSTSGEDALSIYSEVG